MGQVGYATGGFDEGPGSGAWGKHLDMGLGLGMWDMLSWGCGGS